VILIPYQHKVTLRRGAGGRSLTSSTSASSPIYLGFVRRQLSQESSQVKCVRAVVLAHKPFCRAHLAAPPYGDYSHARDSMQAGDVPSSA
jgi:hypothetical protein